MNGSRIWKLLWSLVLIWAICLFFVWWLYPSDSGLQYGMNLFFLFMIGWAIAFGAGAVALLLRLFRIIKNPAAFWYILLGVANLIAGGYGTFQKVRGGWGPGMTTIPVLMIVSFWVGVLILLDALVYDLVEVLKRNK
ncbi:MAG TPA: hypothetical protein VGM30_16645 [Puia sp.]|jgi:hypothetical protein